LRTETPGTDHHMTRAVEVEPTGAASFEVRY
jgi:hypothetical protein